jgi:glycerophosphoryl diester phosphodiesterase
MARHFDLTAFTYAHRGLWSPEGHPENSLAAFKAAAEAGLGIEYDVRPSLSGEVMVFHDPKLARMTGTEGLFEEQDMSVLSALRLAGTDQPVPTLSALLDIWPNNLPLLTEMKIDGNTDPEAFARKVGEQLAGHIGPAAAMSFSEPAVDALPDVLMRGQLIHPIHRTSEAEFDAKLARALDRKVDYLAVNVADAERAAVSLAGGLPFVVWTIRSMADLRRIRLVNGAAIFEHLPVPLAS